MKRKDAARVREWSVDDDTILLMGYAYAQPLEEVADQLRRPVGELIARLTSFGMFPGALSDTVH